MEFFFFSIKKAKLSPLHNCGGSSMMISVSRKLYLANRETLSKVLMRVRKNTESMSELPARNREGGRASSAFVMRLRPVLPVRVSGSRSAESQGIVASSVVVFFRRPRDPGAQPLSIWRLFPPLHLKISFTFQTSQSPPRE